MEPDLFLRGALVVDGTGTPPRPADVAIAGGLIVAVVDRVDDLPTALRGGARDRPRGPRARPRIHRHPHPLRRPGPVGTRT